MLAREELEGKTKEEAENLLKDSRYRIVREDGTSYIVTRDYNISRYNLVVEKGIVTKVTMG